MVSDIPDNVAGTSEGNHLVGLDRAAPWLQPSFSYCARLLANFSSVSFCCSLQSIIVVESHDNPIHCFWFLLTLMLLVSPGHVFTNFLVSFVPHRKRHVVSPACKFCQVPFFRWNFYGFLVLVFSTSLRVAGTLVSGQVSILPTAFTCFSLGI